MRRGEKRGRVRRWLWVLALVLLAALAMVTFRVGGRPAVEVDADLPGIGPRTTVRAQFREASRGLTRVRLELVQGDAVTLLAEEEHRPLPPWAFWGERTRAATLEVAVGSETNPDLREGEATLRASAWPAATWLRHPGAVVTELTLPVRLRPPALSVLSDQHYPSQGGAEAVVYRVGETASRDGVQVGAAWFPGYSLPGGGAGERFALFAVPYEAGSVGQVHLVAEDDVGNRAERAFVDRLQSRTPRSDRVRVSDEFIESVASEIEANTPGLGSGGSWLERYLRINGELRSANREAVRALAAQSREAFLWSRPFLPLPNAQVMASFGDRRTYLYDGEEVDRQQHLGIDLASVRRADVPAANDGVVIAAEYLGIYGNVVVLDHGYGLMTLYGHLSSIEVGPGDAVERGRTLGRTGATGLAGGDHLHFGVFLQGRAVDPIEWWDPSWLRNRLGRKLGGALPLQEAPS